MSGSRGGRAAVVVAHTGRGNIREQARAAGERLLEAGFEVRMEADEAADLGMHDRVTLIEAGPAAAEGAEIVMVLGGDGTFLRAT
jgi:NAD+ kinase